MSAISLISVNVERSKHLPLVEQFLTGNPADVVCIQEIMERDLLFFQSILGDVHHFAPMAIHPDSGTPGVVGVAIFSRLPIAGFREYYYHGNRNSIQTIDFSTVDTKHATESYVAIVADVQSADEMYTVGTTHFTWTPKGGADDYQRADLTEMLSMLAVEHELILCGDFNAPRRGEIFSKIASVYTDNIPSQYLTSLDPARHRAPADEQVDKMVDGVFATPGYKATDIMLHTGVSDHCAVTATIAKT
jgi:exonuclease III